MPDAAARRGASICYEGLAPGDLVPRALLIGLVGYILQSRAFSVVGQSLWNDLPLEQRSLLVRDRQVSQVFLL